MRPKSTIFLTGAIVLFCCWLFAQNRVEDLERGKQWLSWSTAERTAYVNGYISGYLTGRLRACNATDDLFEVGQPHRIGDGAHPSEIPSARCLSAVDIYSKGRLTSSGPHLDVYTQVITEFYERHPEYRNVPFTYLMEQLTDKNYKSAEQLYDLARSGKCCNFPQ
jgi:hypothetical protein